MELHGRHIHLVTFVLQVSSISEHIFVYSVANITYIQS